MKLTLAIATVDPVLLSRCLGQALRTATDEFDVCVFGNGVEVDQGILIHNSVYTEVRPEAHVHVPDLCGGQERRIKFASTSENKGVPLALDQLYVMAKDLSVPAKEHVIVFLHDDVFIFEKAWDRRLKIAFGDDRVELAGFLGAIGLGFADIYKIPYESHHVSRYGGMSNLVNAQAHGERVTEDRPASFVDGMCMAIRQNVLDDINGWSWWPSDIPHYAYDYAMSCMVRRHGGRCRLVPVACQHGVETRGGLASGTTVLDRHRETMNRFGGDKAVYEMAQRFVYDEFRDVLPLLLSEEEFSTFAACLLPLDQVQLRRAFTFLTGSDRRRAAAVLLSHGMPPVRVDEAVNA